jgi:hypothetical protein
MASGPKAFLLAALLTISAFSLPLAAATHGGPHVNADPRPLRAWVQQKVDCLVPVAAVPVLLALWVYGPVVGGFVNGVATNVGDDFGRAWRGEGTPDPHAYSGAAVGFAVDTASFGFVSALVMLDAVGWASETCLS